MFILTGIIEEKDIDRAAELLFEKYNISTQMLHKIYPSAWHGTIRSVNKRLYKSKKSPYSDLIGYNFCRLVVIEEGFNLFSGVEKQEF